jgi:hypothetical protein
VLCKEMKNAGIEFSRLMDTQFRIGSDRVYDFLNDKYSIIKETYANVLAPIYAFISFLSGCAGCASDARISSFFINGIATFAFLIGTHVGIGMIWIGLKLRYENKEFFQ